MQPGCTKNRARPSGATKAGTAMPMNTDRTHDASRVSWVGAQPGRDFPVQKLPLGIFSEAKRIESPEAYVFQAAAPTPHDRHHLLGQRALEPVSCS